MKPGIEPQGMALVDDNCVAISNASFNLSDRDGAVPIVSHRLGALEISDERL